MKYGRDFFDSLYEKWNSPKFIHPDPLEFLHRYKNPADQETAGLIAACLAYGNVKQILKSTENALMPIKERPAATIWNPPGRPWRNCSGRTAWR